MTTVPVARWRTGYTGGWVLGCMGLGVVLAFVGLGDWANRNTQEWVPWLVGVVTGGLVGRWLAARTLAKPAVHRVLRVVGGMAVLAGLVGAVAFYVLWLDARQSNIFLAGLGEIVMTMVCGAGAAVGACFWFAGWIARVGMGEVRAV